uniref:SLAM family member 6-like isoform X1 n=1 Tax=Podarcis muralis TaxID=64176 RepID=UPI00109FC30E|nr:SLAM family member 6-like isoform X1 [Podarcis muralis]
MAVLRSSKSLQTLLLCCTLICSYSGAVSNSSQTQTLRQVSGILGRSVLLPANVSSAERFAFIEWNFQWNGITVQIAKFRDGKLERPDPNDRFGQRIEIANESTLRIKDLEMEDSGIYGVRVTFSTGTLKDHKLCLTVYEPIPEPKILHKDVSKTPGGCNVTLQCRVPGKRGFDVSWKRGDPLRDLDDGSDRYHLTENGTDLHLFWKLNSSGPTYICLVTNPAEQRSNSFNLLDVCKTHSSSGSSISGPPLWFVAVVPLLVMVAGLGFWLWKKSRTTLSQRAVASVRGEEGYVSPGLHYAELPKRWIPSEGGESQVRVRWSCMVGLKQRHSALGELFRLKKRKSVISLQPQTRILKQILQLSTARSKQITETR